MRSAAKVIMEIRLTQLHNMVFSREPGLGPAEGSAPSAGSWDTSLPSRTPCVDFWAECSSYYRRKSGSMSSPGCLWVAAGGLSLQAGTHFYLVSRPPEVRGCPFPEPSVMVVTQRGSGLGALIWACLFWPHSLPPMSTVTPGGHRPSPW